MLSLLLSLSLSQNQVRLPFIHSPLDMFHLRSHWNSSELTAPYCILIWKLKPLWRFMSVFLFLWSGRDASNTGLDCDMMSQLFLPLPDWKSLPLGSYFCQCLTSTVLYVWRMLSLPPLQDRELGGDCGYKPDGPWLYSTISYLRRLTLLSVNSESDLSHWPGTHPSLSLGPIHRRTPLVVQQRQWRKWQKCYRIGQTTLYCLYIS